MRSWYGAIHTVRRDAIDGWNELGIHCGMARFLVHPVFVDRNHDYSHFARAMQELAAFAVTENAWLVQTELSLEGLTKKLFTDRPPANRFLIMEIPNGALWSAANLTGDMAAWLAARPARYPGAVRGPRVFRKGDDA